ncbi:hypothetical protein J437_LFUL008076 [Ladona fulva]|uniref:Uncharacterized protein n=1 Tax=Ladona fulva TaxID=123851 RepID=A0A8K0KAV0_LADFU|nr:hypothetical protein J437_LFUL008076 [Ladona fulva]
MAKANSTNWKRCRCGRDCDLFTGFNPEAAMKVLPMVLIFSTSENSALCSSSSKSPTNSFRTRKYSLPPHQMKTMSPLVLSDLELNWCSLCSKPWLLCHCGSDSFGWSPGHEMSRAFPKNPPPHTCSLLVHTLLTYSSHSETQGYSARNRLSWNVRRKDSSEVTTQDDEQEVELEEMDLFSVETRWKGNKAKELAEGCKLIYSGTDERGRNGVGIIIDKELKRGVYEVEWKSDQIMCVKLEIG